MQRLLLLMTGFLLMPLMLLSQNDSDYVMFQTIKLTPKSGHSNQLMEGLKEHNDTYHTEGFKNVSSN